MPLRHDTALTRAGGTLPSAIQTLQRPLVYDYFAVSVFIVLSGYCLMASVDQSTVRRLRDRIVDYLLRRAFRILPTYYAALLLALLIIRLAPAMQLRTGTYWDGALSAFRSGMVISHFS
jgi:peptidoglycan/LPS O-acetylase OafA/YrhL